MKYIKYFFQFIVIIILFIIFKLLGYKTASNLGSKLGKIFGKIIKSDKIILKNINIIKDYTNWEPKDNNKIVNNVFSNYGRILSEYVYLNKFKNGSLKSYVTFVGKEHLDEIKSKNKRVVFISGHFNNFELMAMFIDSAGINLAAIYRPLNNIFLNKIMENLRINNICRYQIKKGKSGSREILNYLKKNFSIALMIDQRVSEGEDIDLFNRSAKTTTIPAQLVKKYGCSIISVYIERVKNYHFKLYFSKPVKFDDNLSHQQITLELNKILEKMILKNPDQWIWSHDRWK